MSVEPFAMGSCACGLVRYVVTQPVKWCSHCHCFSCRQQHGAPVVTWFGVAWEGFKLAGREHLKWYVCSEEAKRGFCTNCGTPFLFMSTRWPDEVHVARASLRSSKEEIVPTVHVHHDQQAQWFLFEDPLPKVGGLDPADTRVHVTRERPEGV